MVGRSRHRQHDLSSIRQCSMDDLDIVACFPLTSNFPGSRYTDMAFLNSMWRLSPATELYMCGCPTAVT